MLINTFGSHASPRGGGLLGGGGSQSAAQSEEPEAH